MELKEFKKYFYPLIDRVTKTRISYSKKQLYPSFEALVKCLVFSSNWCVCQIRALLIWSSQIKDAETLSKLFQIIYSEMARLHLEILVNFIVLEGIRVSSWALSERCCQWITRTWCLSFPPISADFWKFWKKESTPVLKHLLQARNKIFASQLVTKTERYYLSEEFCNHLSSS